jgi:acetyl esterase/lipase
VGLTPGTDLLEGTEFPLDCFLRGVSDEQRRDPDISPLYADLRGLPRALFSVGTNDHLIDDTLFMAARWEIAGNETELLVYPETPHANIALPSVAGHFFPRLFDFYRACLDVPVPHQPAVARSANTPLRDFLRRESGHETAERRLGHRADAS